MEIGSEPVFSSSSVIENEGGPLPLNERAPDGAILAETTIFLSEEGGLTDKVVIANFSFRPGTIPSFTDFKEAIAYAVKQANSNPLGLKFRPMTRFEFLKVAGLTVEEIAKAGFNVFTLDTAAGEA